MGPRGVTELLAAGPWSASRMVLTSNVWGRFFRNPVRVCEVVSALLPWMVVQSGFHPSSDVLAVAVLVAGECTVCWIRPA